MSHANAALTPVMRLRIARLIVDEGWPVARAAEWFHVSWPTAKRWAQRYAAMGAVAMVDRSSRPHRIAHKTSQFRVRKIVHLRWKKRLSPIEIGARLEMAPSTVHAVLTRCHLNRHSHVDVRTGEPIRRYEHPYAGAMIHVDVKKLGNIPDGGGWRFVGRQQGDRQRAATPATTKNSWHNPKMGTAFVHTVIDDNSRVTYAEIHDDETAATADTAVVLALDTLNAERAKAGLRPVDYPDARSRSGKTHLGVTWNDWRRRSRKHRVEGGKARRPARSAAKNQVGQDQRPLGQGPSPLRAVASPTSPIERSPRYTAVTEPAVGYGTRSRRSRRHAKRQAVVAPARCTIEPHGHHAGLHRRRAHAPPVRHDRHRPLPLPGRGRVIARRHSQSAGRARPLRKPLGIPVGSGGPATNSLARKAQAEVVDTAGGCWRSARRPSPERVARVVIPVTHDQDTGAGVCQTKVPPVG